MERLILDRQLPRSLSSFPLSVYISKSLRRSTSQLWRPSFLNHSCQNTMPGRSRPSIHSFVSSRSFTSTTRRTSWLFPKRGHSGKSRKGRPRVPTGGSTRGTTVVWGDWGLRMRDHERRVSAKQLQTGADTIKKRLRGEKFRLYTRIAANIPVFTSGNEMRMGKGKGSFDHYASRIAVSKIIFEVKGELHEKVVRDAFRIAASKMPGKSLTDFNKDVY